MQIFNADAFNFLESLDDNSVQLCLSDPPYRTGSKKSGTERHLKRIANGIKMQENEWKDHASKFNFDVKNSRKKKNYMKYGSVHGMKFLYQTEFSEWDSTFHPDDLKTFLNLSFKKVKEGGVIIVFFDLWKITNLRKYMMDAGFVDVTLLEWVKSNPVPRNSTRTYLINCREIALRAYKPPVKKYDGENQKIFRYPIYTKKDKIHPTQKSLGLFRELIGIYSNKNDIVIDPYCGSATTLIGAHQLNRRGLGSEICKEYYEKSLERMKIYDDGGSVDTL